MTVNKERCEEMGDFIFHPQGLLEDPELFKEFKDSALSYLEDGAEKLDFGLLPLLEIVNMYEGFATRFSCIGHAEHGWSRTFDLVLVVKDEEHALIIDKVVYKFNTKLKELHDRRARFLEEGIEGFSCPVAVKESSYLTNVYLDGLMEHFLSITKGLTLVYTCNEKVIHYPTYQLSSFSASFENKEQLVYLLTQCFLKYLKTN